MCAKFHGLTRKNQGGRRYFSRREITALVGGPGNMAIYRQTSKCFGNTAYRQSVTVEKRNCLQPKHYRRIALLTPKKYRHILVLPLPPKKYRQL